MSAPGAVMGWPSSTVGPRPPGREACCRRYGSGGMFGQSLGFGGAA